MKTAMKIISRKKKLGNRNSAPAKYGHGDNVVSTHIWYLLMSGNEKRKTVCSFQKPLIRKPSVLLVCLDRSSELLCVCVCVWRVNQVTHKEGRLQLCDRSWEVIVIMRFHFSPHFQNKHNKLSWLRVEQKVLHIKNFHGRQELWVCSFVESHEIMIFVRCYCLCGFQLNLHR